MRTEVVVFGRVPAPGAVNTRLAAEVGPMTAARIYGVLLDHDLLANVRALLADTEVESELRANVMAAMSSRRREVT